MSGSTRNDLSDRNAIMMLLTDEENAQASSVEGGAHMPDGSEFVDLEHLERGVQRIVGTAPIDMAHVIPRSAVGDDTWRKIVTHLAS